jgi:hypothetical protein
VPPSATSTPAGSTQSIRTDSAAAPGESHSSAPITPEVPGAPAVPVALERCDGVGPMACQMAPGSHAELCARASACIERFTTDKNYVRGMSIECDASDRKNIDTAYAKPVPAPAESGLAGVTMVTMVAVEDEYRNVFGSSYLVADFAQGSCLVDVLHEWDKHSLTPDTSFDAEWRPAPQGFRLHVRSHQVLHEALDREEFAAGESDVRSDFCVRIVYDVVGGRFARVSESSSEGGCRESGAR